MRKKKLNQMGLASKIIIYGIVALYAFACIFAFVLVVVVSFTPQDVISKQGYSFFPSKLTLDAYRYVFKFPMTILRAYGVSIFVAAVGTILNTVITVMIAYPLSRPTFRYRKAISFYVFFTMMFSGGTIPYFILTKRFLHLADTLWVLILPLMVVPMHVFLLRVFMQSLPESLHESAVLDGANEFTILGKIVIPLMKPGIATVAMFILLMYWNDVFTAKLFISDTLLYPLQMVLDNYTEFINSLSSNAISAAMMGITEVPSDAIMFAMCIIATGPMLFVFLGFQKYFVSGLTMGAIKN